MKKKRFILRTESVRKNAVAYIQQIRDDDKLMCVTVEPYVKQRSVSQNKLLHMWLRIIGDDTGNTVDDLRDEFAKRLLVTETYTSTDGKLHKRIPSTSNLSTGDFVRFLNDIEHFALHELNITLPHPEDLWLEAMAA